MATIAERNRAIKKTLETAFGRGKVRVRGDRGTAYGWVDVHIDWTPLDANQAGEMRTKIWQLLTAAKLSQEIGTYGYDHPGSDYGYGNKINISFNPARYYRTQRMSDGRLAVLRDPYLGAEWETVGDCPSKAPDAVMSAMETETDPLPDAVASAWDTELNPPQKTICDEEAQAIQQIADNTALARQLANEGRRAKKRR